MFDTRDNAYPLIELLPPIILAAIVLAFLVFILWPAKGDS